MVLLRSYVLSICKIISYSYISCRGLESSVFIFHWGLFDLLYPTIFVFTFTNSFIFSSFAYLLTCLELFMGFLQFKNNFLFSKIENRF